MPHLAHAARIGFPALLALSLAALAGACGGRSVDGPDGAATGGSTGQGGKSTAGGSSKAGASSSGGGPMGGAGGSPGGAACNAPPESGTCNAYFQAWYHDPATGVCKPFVYGGCGGNDNRYDSLEACQKSCSGGEPNHDACTQPSDCVVRSRGCCGICDGPGITKHDVIAHNRQYVESCPDILCGPCPAPSPGSGTLANFIPDCVNQQCTVIDVRESWLSACRTDRDCVLRNGNDCCERCGASDAVIAVNADRSFEMYVCGDVSVVCPGCAPAPTPAPALRAVCEASGHCAVTVTLQPE